MPGSSSNPGGVGYCGAGGTPSGELTDSDITGAPGGDSARGPMGSATTSTGEAWAAAIAFLLASAMMVAA